MKFLFDDESFSFETLRAAGFSADGGSDLGEILVTAAKIGEGDEDAWYREWKITADRIYKIGQGSLGRDHKISAREAFLRASNYYRVAEFYRRKDPVNDPEVRALLKLSRETFLKAAALLDGPVEEVPIPYGEHKLPAYFFLVDGSGKPRPTVIYNNGFDSTREEAYFAIAAAALRRGYNVLAFDGPGQGAALREDGLLFRPDWEAVMTPVLDWATARPEVEKNKIALFGYSLGALLVARAAAFDKRPAALLLDDGMFDFFDVHISALPPFLVEWVRDGKDDYSIPVAQLLMKMNTGARWAVQNGVWTFGAKSVPDYLRQTANYTLKDIIHQIECPTLVLDAEEDKFLRGQPQKVAASLKCPNKLVTLRAADGAGEHCHMGAMRLAHQTMFDWLDETFAYHIHVPN
jgi:pimeloyl-ACP methyl ester carboxylesterase